MGRDTRYSFEGMEAHVGGVQYSGQWKSMARPAAAAAMEERCKVGNKIVKKGRMEEDYMASGGYRGGRRRVVQTRRLDGEPRRRITDGGPRRCITDRGTGNEEVDGRDSIANDTLNELTRANGKCFNWTWAFDGPYTERTGARSAEQQPARRCVERRNDLGKTGGDLHRTLSDPTALRLKTPWRLRGSPVILFLNSRTTIVSMPTHHLLICWCSFVVISRTYFC